MEKFIGVDRQRGILSAFIGAMLVSGSCWLIHRDIWLLDILAVLLIIFTYLILPICMFYDRELLKRDGMIFNSDGKDVTRSVPKDFILQIIGFFIISGVLTTNIHGFIIHLKSENRFYVETLEIVDGIEALLIPYLIIHIYFLIKNLPTITWLRYVEGRDSTIHKTAVNNSNQDIYYNPGYSSYSSNIYHNLRKH